MNNNFTMELNTERFNIEMQSTENGTQFHLYAEFYYSEEAPTFDIYKELTPSEAKRITPERAAALVSMIASYATIDIETEAEFNARTNEEYANCETLDDIPVYPFQFDGILFSMVHSFCYGDAYGKACEN